MVPCDPNHRSLFDLGPAIRGLCLEFEKTPDCGPLMAGRIGSPPWSSSRLLLFVGHALVGERPDRAQRWHSRPIGHRLSACRLASVSIMRDSIHRRADATAVG